MTVGDYIRSKSDRELAEMFVNTINANMGVEDLYLISLDPSVPVLAALGEDDLEDTMKMEIERW